MTWGAQDTWWVHDGSTSAALTNKSLKAAPAAGYAHYITDINITNEGAANVVQLLNGSGGLAVFSKYMAANVSETIALHTPIKLTAATALCVTSTANDHMIIDVGGYTDIDT